MEKYKVNAAKLNLRFAPSIENEPIGLLLKGETVEFVKKSEDGKWIKVKKGTKEGWVSSQYLEMNQPEEFPWMPIAAQEIGVKETDGDGDNPRILEYLQSVHLDTSTNERRNDETLWCSAFVNWCVKKAGLTGTNRSAADSWLKWGESLAAPRRGCIAVFKRGGGNHVAFFVGQNADEIEVLGGNQSDQVNIAKRRKSDLLDYRIPKLLILLFLWLAINSTVDAQTYKPPIASASLLDKIDFNKAVELDSGYKKRFDGCDKKRKKCASDPNNLKALLRFGDDAVFFDSKMSLDLDGSSVGCNCGNNMGAVDQCSTSYYWKDFPSNYDKSLKKDRCKFYRNQYFVDSNEIPFIVIPREFENRFMINNQPYNFLDNSKGADLGVVVYKDKLIPVMVADAGPNFRIGEGSAALFRAIGEDRCKTFQGKQCTKFKNYSVSKNVLFFVFPNSRIGKDKLTKDNALELINQEAMKRFDDFKKSFQLN